MNALFAAALGGAVGAAGRYFVAGRVMHLVGSHYPYGTLAVNVLGAFLMGVLVEASALRLNMSNEMRSFLAVGVLGGFTTFSAFSLEVFLMIDRHETVAAMLYAVGSIVLTLAALFAGLLAVRAAL